MSTKRYQSHTELTVCYVPLEDITTDVVSCLVSRLTRDERHEAQRKLRSEDQLAFAAGRVLVRHMLSTYASAPPGGWRFQRSSSGKPALVPSLELPDLRFNLSHTRGLVAAVVAVGREVGIDAELADERVDYVGIARAYFSPSEVQMIESRSGAGQLETFFALWTIKEAYLKAQGEGLLGSLSQCAIRLEPLSMSLQSHPESPLQDWHLWRDRPTHSHFVAVAAEQEPGESLYCRPTWIHIHDLLTA